MDHPATPVVVDCDPGVDDAIALLLAVQAPEIDLRAVTTVAGNAAIDVVTANAAAVLDLADAQPDLPMAAGSAGPLRGGERVPDEPIHGTGCRRAGPPTSPMRRARCAGPSRSGDGGTPTRS